ncbi:MAG: VWA domain-containing protein [Leptolinea sp.]
MKINLRTLRSSFSILALSSMLMGFSPVKSVVPQEENVTVRITQVDNSKFPAVTVYVSVLDAHGEPVAVDAKRLEIRENGKVIPVKDIKGAGQVGPLTTLLVMDVSGSMEKGGKLDSAKVVAKEYINQMREGDQAGIILFNTMVRTSQLIKSNKAELSSGIDMISAGGDTAMYDALISAVGQLNNVSGRKAILVYTDGLDNRSKSNAESVISAIGSGGLTISTVGFGDASQGLGSQESLDEATLKNIAEKSSGRYGYAENQQELSNLYASFGKSMRSEYELTYQSPSAMRNGINRGLKVTLKSPFGAANQPGDSTTYNPGGLIPEVPVSGSWGMFFGLLVFLGLVAAAPLGLPWVKEKLNRPKATIKIKEPKKVAIKLKN